MFHLSQLFKTNEKIVNSLLQVFNGQDYELTSVKTFILSSLRHANPTPEVIQVLYSFLSGEAIPQNRRVFNIEWSTTAATSLLHLKPGDSDVIIAILKRICLDERNSQEMVKVLKRVNPDQLLSVLTSSTLEDLQKKEMEESSEDSKKTYYPAEKSSYDFLNSKYELVIPKEGFVEVKTLLMIWKKKWIKISSDANLLICDPHVS